jgi:hypothetical protein
MYVYFLEQAPGLRIWVFGIRMLQPSYSMPSLFFRFFRYPFVSSSPPSLCFFTHPFAPFLALSFFFRVQRPPLPFFFSDRVCLCSGRRFSRAVLREYFLGGGVTALPVDFSTNYMDHKRRHRKVNVEGSSTLSLPRFCCRYQEIKSACGTLLQCPKR